MNGGESVATGSSREAKLSDPVGGGGGEEGGTGASANSRAIPNGPSCVVMTCCSGAGPGSPPCCPTRPINMLPLRTMQGPLGAERVRAAAAAPVTMAR